MRQARRNERYLPDAGFPDALQVTNDLQRSARRRARRAHRRAVACIPRNPRERSSRTSTTTRVIAWATKGFEIATGLLPHQVARAGAGLHGPGPVLSGPTFAKEVGAGLPTAMTVALRRRALRQRACPELVGAQFPRLYAIRYHGCRGGRRRQECHRHRLRYRRWHGIRRQHARGIDHARARRNDASRREDSAPRARLSWASQGSAI